MRQLGSDDSYKKDSGYVTIKNLRYIGTAAIKTHTKTSALAAATTAGCPGAYEVLGSALIQRKLYVTELATDPSTMGSLYNGDWSDYGLYKGYNTAYYRIEHVYSDRARLLTWNVDTYGDSGCFTVSPGVIIPNFSPGPLGHISCKYVVINKTPQVGSQHTISALMGNFCGGFTRAYPNANNWYGDVTGTYSYKNTKDAVYAAYGVVNRQGGNGTNGMTENNVVTSLTSILTRNIKLQIVGHSAPSIVNRCSMEPYHNGRIYTVLRDSLGMTGLNYQCTMHITEDLVL